MVCGWRGGLERHWNSMDFFSSSHFFPPSFLTMLAAGLIHFDMLYKTLLRFFAAYLLRSMPYGASGGAAEERGARRGRERGGRRRARGGWAGLRGGEHEEGSSSVLGTTRYDTIRYNTLLERNTV